MVVAVAVLAVVLIPVATSSGRALAHHLGAQDLVRHHSAWGRRLLPCMVVVLLAAATQVVLDIARRAAPAARPVSAPLTAFDRLVAAHLPRQLRDATATLWLRRLELAVAAVCVLAALVTLFVVVQTGESGARAVWSGR